MPNLKVAVGDILRIPLPDGRYAFGRVLRDASVGIYRETTAASGTPPSATDYMFVVGVYDDVLASGRWPVVGHADFSNPEDEWPPPYCITDKITGRMSLYHKGQTRPASEAECRGREPAAVWDAHHIVERILKAN
jgi:hypothetical protein